MNSQLCIRLLACIAMLFSVGAMSQTSDRASPSSKLQGVWKIVEVKSSGPNATTNSTPPPGMLFLGAKHYSFIREYPPTPRPALPEDLTKATAAELLAVFRPFAANAGTYEVAGDRFTYSPTVAIRPATMAAGFKVVNGFKLEGNTLWITGISTPSGPFTNPETLKFVRLE